MGGYRYDIEQLKLGLGGGSPSNITETVQDIVGAMVTAGTNITVTYNDPSNTLTIDSTATSLSGSLWNYKGKTSATSGYPGDGYVLWNNATQTSATSIIISHLDQHNNDIDRLLSLINTGQTVLLQDQNASANYQIWTVSGTPTNTNAGLSNSYWTIPVTLSSSGGTGTTGFSNNTALLVAVKGGGAGDVAGPGSSTDNAITRFNGTTGKSIQNSASILSDTDTISTPNAAADEIGFKGIPQNSISADYTLVLADASKCIYKGSGGAITVTIPANGSVAYPIGTCIEGINDDTETMTIAITTDTLVLAPSGTTGSRTVAAKGWWAIRKVTSTKWYITGAGVT